MFTYVCNWSVFCIWLSLIALFEFTSVTVDNVPQSSSFVSMSAIVFCELNKSILRSRVWYSLIVGQSNGFLIGRAVSPIAIPYNSFDLLYAVWDKCREHFSWYSAQYDLTVTKMCKVVSHCSPPFNFDCREISIFVASSIFMGFIAIPVDFFMAIANPS